MNYMDIWTSLRWICCNNYNIYTRMGDQFQLLTTLRYTIVSSSPELRNYYCECLNCFNFWAGIVCIHIYVHINRLYELVQRQNEDGQFQATSGTKP